jgi:hypothetical protein
MPLDTRGRHSYAIDVFYPFWNRGKEASENKAFMYNSETQKYDILGALLHAGGYDWKVLDGIYLPSQAVQKLGMGSHATFVDCLRWLCTNAQTDSEDTLKLLTVNDDPNLPDEGREKEIAVILGRWDIGVGFHLDSSKASPKKASDLDKLIRNTFVTPLNSFVGTYGNHDAPPLYTDEAFGHNVIDEAERARIVRLRQRERAALRQERDDGLIGERTWIRRREEINQRYQRMLDGIPPEPDTTPLPRDVFRERIRQADIGLARGAISPTMHEEVIRAISEEQRAAGGGISRTATIPDGSYQTRYTYSDAHLTELLRGSHGDETDIS